MSNDRSLLERLMDPTDDVSRSTRSDPKVLADSVLSNLRRLLNSRHGHALTCDNYGIPDPSDVALNYPEAIGKMGEEIKHSIEKFEPRLQNVSVTHVDNRDDPMALNFEITARLVSADERTSIWFETRVDPNGEIRVKS